MQLQLCPGMQSLAASAPVLQQLPHLGCLQIFGSYLHCAIIITTWVSHMHQQGDDTRLNTCSASDPACLAA